ncbi:MAG: cation transporter [Eubacteriales bacterium]|nr:cation transporter [Eubacteriales bacterium]
MTQKQIERKALKVSCVVNFFMFGAGFWAFAETNIQALFLDCFFSLIAFSSCLSALTISKISGKKTANYPGGLYFLEPLFAVFKSLLTLGLSAFSVIGTAKTAWKYFCCGIGEPLVIGPVIPYAVIMVILCLGLGFFNKGQNRRTNDTSTILAAEAKGNFVDGVLSLGVGISALLLKRIDIGGSLGFLHHIGDFFITVILVLLSVKEPAVMLASSFRELTGGVLADRKLEGQILELLEKNLRDVLLWQNCEIYKVGMHIRIYIYLSSGADYKNVQTAKENLRHAICAVCENAEFIFCQ